MDEQIEPTEVLADQDQAREVLKEDGLALEFGTEQIRADKLLVLLAVKQRGLALKFASSELRDDREVVLEAVRQTGYALQFVSSGLQADKEVVSEAVLQTGFALKWADESLRIDEDMVLLAERYAPAPERLSRFAEFQAIVEEESFKAAVASAIAAQGEPAPQLSVALTRVSNDGDEAEHQNIRCEVSQQGAGAAFTCQIRDDGGDAESKRKHPNLGDLAKRLVEELRKHTEDNSEDVVLLALRCLRSRAFSASHLAMTQAVVCFPHFQKTFMASVAALGEQAPVATVTLIPKEAKEKKEAGAEERGKGEGADDEEEAEEEAEEEEDFFFRFEVRLMSGATFFVEVSPGTAGGDATAAAQRACPNLNALAQKVVQALPKNSEAPPASRVFINFATDDESDCVTVSPWDWDRPLTDFLPPKIAGKTS